MGNGDGPYIHPEWQIGKLYPVNVPFILNGERAIIMRLSADMYSGNVDNVQLEVRIDYPGKPKGDVFWLPFKFYTPKELITAIQAQEQERINQKQARETEELRLYSLRMGKRSEIDALVAKIVEGLGEKLSVRLEE